MLSILYILSHLIYLTSLWSRYLQSHRTIKGRGQDLTQAAWLQNQVLSQQAIHLGRGEASGGRSYPGVHPWALGLSPHIFQFKSKDLPLVQLLSEQKVSGKKTILSHHAFNVHTYHSCLNTAGTRKGPLPSRAQTPSWLGRTKLPLPDSHWGSQAHGPPRTSRRFFWVSSLSLALQANKQGLDNHCPDILEISAPAGELKLTNF